MQAGQVTHPKIKNTPTTSNSNMSLKNKLRGAVKPKKRVQPDTVDAAPATAPEVTLPEVPAPAADLTAPRQFPKTQKYFKTRPVYAKQLEVAARVCSKLIEPENASRDRIVKAMIRTASNDDLILACDTIEEYLTTAVGYQLKQLGPLHSRLIMASTACGVARRRIYEKSCNPGFAGPEWIEWLRVYEGILTGLAKLVPRATPAEKGSVKTLTLASGEVYSYRTWRMLDWLMSAFDSKTKSGYKSAGGFPITNNPLLEIECLKAYEMSGEWRSAYEGMEFLPVTSVSSEKAPDPDSDTEPEEVPDDEVSP